MCYCPHISTEKTKTSKERLHKKVAYNTGSLAASTNISPPEGRKSRHQCWQENQRFPEGFQSHLGDSLGKGLYGKKGIFRKEVI